MSLNLEKILLKIVVSVFNYNLNIIFFINKFCVL